MMTGAVSRRAQELAAQGTAFVSATVVRAQRPTSVEAGNVALVLGDGTIDGFVGGVCAEHSVRLYSLKVLESGEALLLRILPDGPGDDEGAGREVASEEGAVTVQNPCLSGGAIEIFLEPVLPAPRVLVSGETPIAAVLRRLGPELGGRLRAAIELPFFNDAEIAGKTLDRRRRRRGTRGQKNDYRDRATQLHCHSPAA